MRPVADGEREGRHVAGGDRGAAHERVRPDAAELVDAREAAEGREVLDLDVAGERGGVGEDRVAPDEAVVGHVRLGHEQVVRPDAGEPPAPGRPPVDGRALAEHVAVADLDAARLPAELEVLRHEPDRAEREEAVVLAHARVAVDHHVRVEHRPPPEARLVPDHAEGPHPHARLEHGAGRDASQGVDLGRRHASPPGAGAAPRPRARRPPARRRGSARDRPAGGRGAPRGAAGRRGPRAVGTSPRRSPPPGSRPGAGREPS